MTQKRSNVFIISAPSGAGKSTLIQRLLAQNSNFLFSISHTTRAPRQGETNGVDYFFVSEEIFRNMIAKEELLEWAEVHGAFYGTSKKMVEQAAEQGCDLILDIDVQGAAKVKKLLPDAISIFILPPSYQALLERLRLRQKDTEEQIAKRIENARQEIQHCSEYDYIIINHSIDTAFDDLNCIVSSQHHTRESQHDEISAILKSFVP